MMIGDITSEPIAWWIAEGITTIMVIALIGLVKIGYKSFAAALNELKEAIKELSITVTNINKFLERQDEININNIKEHDNINYDLEDYHQRLNKAETKINKIETIEDNCPSNPFKK